MRNPKAGQKKGKLWKGLVGYGLVGLIASEHSFFWFEHLYVWGSMHGMRLSTPAENHIRSYINF